MPAKKKNQINLLPKEDFDKTTLGRVLTWALTTFRYIVIFVELIVVGGFLSRFYFDVQISNLNDSINEQSSAIKAKYEILELPFRKIQTKLAILSDISKEANSVIPVLDELAQNTPTDSQIVSLSKKDDKVIIQIATYSESSALAFTESLRNSEQFSNFFISRVESEKDSPFITYTLEGIINY
jgi:hypothetical protein